MPFVPPTVIDDDGSGMTGTVLNKAFFDAYNAAISPAFANWTAYTPVWKTTGTPQPAIGNGTLAGRYLVVGKTVYFVIGMRAGSATTYGGAGLYSWSLPSALAGPANIGDVPTYVFAASMLTGAGSAQVPVATYLLGGYDFYAVTSAGGIVGPTVPFTWATGCAISLRGTYDI